MCVHSQASDVFEFVGLRSGGLPSASDFQTKYRVAGVNLEQSEVQNIINAVDYVCRWDNRNNELRYDLI